MNRSRTRHLRTAILLAAILALLSACAPLQPVDLPDEHASPAADAPLWQSLAVGGEGDWFHLLNVGAEALDWRLLALDSATSSVDLQTFLWSEDAVGAAVAGHLLSAADRGVRIRLLVDDTFMLGDAASLLELDRHPGIEFRIYNPYQRRSDSFVTRAVLNLGDFDRLDHRMHNKLMIVDNRVAIAGGRNLADEYFGFHETVNFRDLELLVGGPQVSDLSSAFDDYWNDDWSFPAQFMVDAGPAGSETPRSPTAESDVAAIHPERDESGRRERWESVYAESAPGSSYLLVDEPPGRNPADPAEAPIQVAAALAGLLDSAREEIIVHSAYLIPTPRLEAAVESAIARGVSVRILTNSIGSNNHLAAHSAYRNHIDELLGHGVALYEMRTDARDRRRYMTAPVEDKELALHAKVLLIDRDRVFVGSANLDPRSLRLNTEMGILVESETLNARLRAAMLPDFDAANAWSLQLDPQGKVNWVSGDTVLTEQPAESFMQNIEDWFFAHLPIEDEM